MLRAVSRVLPVLPRGAPARCFGAKISFPVDDEDQSVFPNEGPGNNYGLNWSLCGDQIVPGGNAFRFTKIAQATAMLGSAPAAPKGKTPAVLEAGSDALSFQAFDDAFKKAQEHLESGAPLYVAEGDVKGTRTPCRVITDSLPLAAGAMAHALDRMPLREPTELPVVIYATSGDASFAGLSFELGYPGNEDRQDETRAKCVLSGSAASVEGIVAGAKEAANGLAEEDASASA